MCPTTMGSVPGNALAFMVRMLKSDISIGLGRLVPASTRHSWSMMATSRSTSSRPRLWTTNMPVRPSAIWVISSWCEWYMNVPFWRIGNS